MANDREKILKAPCQCGSGKSLGECHGADAPPAPPAALAGSPVTRCLDLASGQSPRAGFEGVDRWPGAQHVVDLQKFPWPFEDGSVAELHCSHYIEHIPMRLVGSHDILAPVMEQHLHPYIGMDTLCAFFSECYRILAPDGTMTVIWPSHRSDRAYWDPTHRRFIAPEVLWYLNETWRRANKLDHYQINTNFLSEWTASMPEEIRLRFIDVQISMLKNYWNTTVDWIGKLKKMPRL